MSDLFFFAVCLQELSGFFFFFFFVCLFVFGLFFFLSAGISYLYRLLGKSRVPNQNGVTQACYIVKIYHSSPEPSKLSLLHV